MTVLIDLESYAAEFEAFAALAEDFVDGASTVRLDEILRRLNAGVGAGAPKWSWTTRAPIVFKTSNRYDGPGKMPLDTSLELSFDYEFERPKEVKKSVTTWAISAGSTHVVLRQGKNTLPVHFDYKNKDQWGPQAHFQVSETVSSIPIPRIFAAAFLPTDCADIMLSELHHEEWRQVQAAGASSRHVAMIRDAQENRSKAYLADIVRQWSRQKRASTRMTMLQDYSATVEGLPNHNDRHAKL